MPKHNKRLTERWIDLIVDGMQTDNTHSASQASQPDSDPRSPEYLGEDEISFRPIFKTLWGYRKRIALAVTAVMAVFVITVLAVYLLMPSERIASLGFRLTFDGVDKGEYPNGVKFSTSEIISTPVLSDVFATNNLDRYFGNFEDFKNSVFMMESNPDIELLDYEYQAKLADTKLTPVDRARVEAEYQDKRKSLTAPTYSLNLRRQERAVTMPASMINKVLDDILANWAQQADQRKGALKYNIPVYSRNILQKDFIENEDYIVAVDILRAKVVRVLASIDGIATLPGASVIRVGPERISLGEIRVNLEDILRFKLQPLVGMIRQTGLSKDLRLLRAYLDNQLFQIKLEHEEQLKKTTTLQDSLRTYMIEKGTIAVQGGQQAQRGGATAPLSGNLETPALIPQFGESFLDRLVALSTQNSDVKYRQELTDKIIAEGFTGAALDKESMYYDDLMSTLKELKPTSSDQVSAEKTPAVQLIKARTQDAMDGILKALDQINAVYKELSAQNLNPRTMLFTVTQPFSIRTDRALTSRSAAMYGALTLFLALFLAPVGCLMHNYFRSLIAKSSGVHSPLPGRSDELATGTSTHKHG
jgi:hypothetical protein